MNAQFVNWRNIQNIINLFNIENQCFKKHKTDYWNEKNEKMDMGVSQHSVAFWALIESSINTRIPSHMKNILQ